MYISGLLIFNKLLYIKNQNLIFGDSEGTLFFLEKLSIYFCSNESVMKDIRRVSKGENFLSSGF